MDAAGRVSDEWCREKFIQEADNVLMHINAQVLNNREEFNALSVLGGSLVQEVRFPCCKTGF